MNQTENVNTSWFISIQQFLKYCLIIILFNRINVNQFAKFQCVLSVYLTRSYVRQHTFIWFFIYLFIFITFSSHIIFNLTNKYKILSVLPYAGSSIFLKKYFFKRDFIVPEFLGYIIHSDHNITYMYFKYINLYHSFMKG